MEIITKNSVYTFKDGILSGGVVDGEGVKAEILRLEQDVGAIFRILEDHTMNFHNGTYEVEAGITIITSPVKLALKGKDE